MVVVFLFLLAFGVLEVFVFAQVADAMGFWNALGLLILISLVGAWVVRREGWKVWQRINQQLAQGRVPQGEVVDARGRRRPAADALSEAGLTPVTLAEKEGLALINGTDGMLGMLVLALHDLDALLDAADLAAAMSVEALLGTDRVFAEDLQRLRPQAGQAVSAARIAAALRGSPIVASHAGPEDTRVQERHLPGELGRRRAAGPLVLGVLLRAEREPRDIECHGKMARPLVLQQQKKHGQEPVNGVGVLPVPGRETVDRKRVERSESQRMAVDDQEGRLFRVRHA